MATARLYKIRGTVKPSAALKTAERIAQHRFAGVTA